MLDQLGQLFLDLEREPNVRCVVLSGAGDKAFCAGTDIAELSVLDQAAATEASRRGQDLCNQIEQLPIPVISAINGIAAGGGFEIVLASHLRLAASHARFSLPEIKLGLIPGYGGTQRLEREIGSGRARELILLGSEIKADEALRLGLVNRVVEFSALQDEAAALASEISQLAPLAIRSCLEAVRRGSELSLEDGLVLETELFARLFASRDMREGTRAFLQKRKPVFNGT